jgi:hypothetical protein
VYGNPVNLLIDLQGFPDGRIVQFKIFKRASKGEKEDTFFIETAGITKGGKGIGTWYFPSLKPKGTLPLIEELKEKVEEEKYYFKAYIDKVEKESEDIILLYPLTILIVDLNKTPVKGVELSVTFSDGSKKQGVTDEKGFIHFNDAPSGKFQVDLKVDKFVFDTKT